MLTCLELDTIEEAQAWLKKNNLPPAKATECNQDGNGTSNDTDVDNNPRSNSKNLYTPRDTSEQGNNGNGNPDENNHDLDRCI